MNKISILKAIKTKLLNRKWESMEEFEDIQDKLNDIELQMKMIKEEL